MLKYLHAGETRDQIAGDLESAKDSYRYLAVLQDVSIFWVQKWK